MHLYQKTEVENVTAKLSYKYLFNCMEKWRKFYQFTCNSPSYDEILILHIYEILRVYCTTQCLNFKIFMYVIPNRKIGTDSGRPLALFLPQLCLTTGLVMLPILNWPHWTCFDPCCKSRIVS